MLADAGRRVVRDRVRRAPPCGVASQVVSVTNPSLRCAQFHKSASVQLERKKRTVELWTRRRLDGVPFFGEGSWNWRAVDAATAWYFVVFYLVMRRFHSYRAPFVALSGGRASSA